MEECLLAIGSAGNTRRDRHRGVAIDTHLHVVGLHDVVNKVSRLDQCEETVFAADTSNRQP